MWGGSRFVREQQPNGGVTGIWIWGNVPRNKKSIDRLKGIQKINGYTNLKAVVEMT